MASNEILDDLKKRHKPRLTPFQRTVRLISFFSWVAFLIGVFFKFESWPGASALIVPALTILFILYLILPIPLFRSRGLYQHLVAHWVGAMMLGFILGLLVQFESWDSPMAYSLVAGLGSIIGLLGVVFFMVKKSGDQDDNRFWTSMLVRLFIVALLTSGSVLRFIQYNLF